MIVYAIRHGQCYSNSKGIYCTPDNNPLTEQGFEDARKIGQLLKNIKFDKIYASSSQRALQTAETAMPGCKPIIDDRLRECDFGSLALKSIKECLATMGSEFVHNWNIRDYSSYGGETTHDQIERVKSFLHDIENPNPDLTVAVFCHEGTIKSMLSVSLDCEFLFKNISLDNCALAIFEFKENSWKLKKWGVS